jgi:CubicO group peptidase (beta-lactamase class C family)
MMEILLRKYAPVLINTVMLGWSIKSLTAAMISILVRQNKLSIDAPAPVLHGPIPKSKRSL